MLQNLLSAAVVIGALRANFFNIETKCLLLTKYDLRSLLFVRMDVLMFLFHFDDLSYYDMIWPQIK